MSDTAGKTSQAGDAAKTTGDTTITNTVIVKERTDGKVTGINIENLTNHGVVHITGNHDVPLKAEPTTPRAELVLKLKNPRMLFADGKRRAIAEAALVYCPPEKTARKTESAPFELTAPLGPIEAGELAWYLETFWRWPTQVSRERAALIESHLPKWGKLLYDSVKNEDTQEAFAAWENAEKSAVRCFSVLADRAVPRTRSDEEKASADEAATQLLSLPWELLHDSDAYLFQDAEPTRVRRQLPNRAPQDILLTEPPVRVLLVSPRPEDDHAGYIDHRVSARPLVEALAPLGARAELTLLTPPTFEALDAALEKAKKAGTPYHVVHFDGHGVYDPTKGLGALVFEAAADSGKPTGRGSQIVHAEDIAEKMKQHRVPLVFLDACQGAKADKDPTASVAGRLLEGGVASVVAMSHSVLVETARRFVEAFYDAIVEGRLVGQAMLAGQIALKNDAFRFKTHDGRLNLQDWFVPVLYQEENDPQLIALRPGVATETKPTEEPDEREGALPPTPKHTFVGRSRELLAAEQILETKRYVVLTGEGGEGKTTLAAELARWLVATNRFQRAAFVSFEQHQTAEAALAYLGGQLVDKYVAKTQGNYEKGLEQIQSALEAKSTLLVLDNMETVLPPPPGSPGAAAFEPDICAKILALCNQLRGVGKTRLLFTSRERMPEPFTTNTVGLGRLSQSDAIELVAQALGRDVKMPGTPDTQASDAEVKALVEAVNCHARALVLLTNAVKASGVRNATTQVQRLMREMDAQYPDDRERSLLASVRLSLNRLPADIRQIIRPLGVFQGGGWLEIIRIFLQIEEQETALTIGRHLVGVGLAEPQDYNYLRFDPALAPALLSELSDAEQEAVRDRWAEAMEALANFLYQQRNTDPHLAFGLAAWEMPNLLAALEHRAKTADAAAVIDFATNIEGLAQPLGRGQAVALAGGIRATAAKGLGEWSHAAFIAEAATIDRLLDAGRFADAISAAENLLVRCQTAGEASYPGADYNTAWAYFKLGRARQMGGASGAALELLAEAERRFDALASSGGVSAARMASVARSEKAECLMYLGRLDEAANLYEQVIKERELLNDPRGAAANRSSLGTIRMLQRRYDEALQAYAEARVAFEKLGEPQSVAAVWHQIGIVYRQAGDYGAAERAYLESLRIEIQSGNRNGQASTLSTAPQNRGLEFMPP